MTAEGAPNTLGRSAAQGGRGSRCDARGGPAKKQPGEAAGLMKW